MGIRGCQQFSPPPPPFVSIELSRFKNGLQSLPAGSRRSQASKFWLIKADLEVVNYLTLLENFISRGHN
jgi:hypothetical protein